jgi:hypothetical protein
MIELIFNNTSLSWDYGLAVLCWLNDVIQTMIHTIFGGIAMTNAPHTTENLTIHIKVKDYSTWRQAYDGHEKSRISAGITNGRVFRNAQDQNDIVILQDVADAAKARSWLGSDDMKATMQKSGVVGSPQVRFDTAA